MVRFGAEINEVRYYMDRGICLAASASGVATWRNVLPPAPKGTPGMKIAEAPKNSNLSLFFLSLISKIWDPPLGVSEAL